MIEVRRDLDLPYVEAEDPAVTKKMAELICNVIDSSLPGLGVVTTELSPKAHRTVHYAHRRLFLSAVQLLEPKVLADATFQPAQLLFRGIDPRPYTHADGHNRHMGLVRKAGVNRLPMNLRLHTADPRNGADVLLTNSGPGRTSISGDSALLYDEEEPAERGYDCSRTLFDDEVMNSMMSDGTYDPIYTEPEVFHFEQVPLASVLFRSNASLGPVSVHSFASMNLVLPREALISDIRLYA